jgi:hypothetical protein
MHRVDRLGRRCAGTPPELSGGGGSWPSGKGRTALRQSEKTRLRDSRRGGQCPGLGQAKQGKRLQRRGILRHRQATCKMIDRAGDVGMGRTVTMHPGVQRWRCHERCQCDHQHRTDGCHGRVPGGAAGKVHWPSSEEMGGPWVFPQAQSGRLRCVSNPARPRVLFWVLGKCGRAIGGR